MQTLNTGLFDLNLIRVVRTLICHFFMGVQGGGLTIRRIRRSDNASGRQQKPDSKKLSPNGNSRDVRNLFLNAPMAWDRLNKLLYKIGKANAKIPILANAPKSHGFVQSVPVAVFGSAKDAIKAYFEMFKLALNEVEWQVEYCPRVRVEEFDLVSMHLYHVPIWFILDLQHNLPSATKKERVNLGVYNTHPIATLTAMMLNPDWLASFGKTIDGVKVGGADIVTVVLPGLRQKFCPTSSHREIAKPHCVTLQVHPKKKIIHIGLRPVNAIPCGSMLIPLVVSRE